MRRLGGAPVRGVAAGLLMVAALLLFLSTGRGQADPGPETRPADVAEPVTPDRDPTSSEAPLVVPEGSAAARPARLDIAAVGIGSTLDPLDQLANGEVEAPPRWGVAGWYSGGARPGETGPAVIAGHVDSPDGPSVFADLTQVRPGDVVTVTDVAGEQHRFRVDRTQVAPRDRFPTRAVYGPTPDAQLRLITCDGPYVASAGGYQDNFIVYATKVTS